MRRVPSLLRLRLHQASSSTSKERENQILQRKRDQILGDCHVPDREPRDDLQKEEKQKKCHCFAQACSLEVGFTKFGKKDKDRAHKELE